MAKYRKKPVVIEAWRWNGREDMAKAIIDWMGGAGRYVTYDKAHGEHLPPELHITTLEDGALGEVKHAASPGDFIIQGVQGEFYACKPDIFAATYEPAD